MQTTQLKNNSFVMFLDETYIALFERICNSLQLKAFYKNPLQKNTKYKNPRHVPSILKGGTNVEKKGHCRLKSGTSA